MSAYAGYGSFGGYQNQPIHGNYSLGGGGWQNVPSMQSTAGTQSMPINPSGMAGGGGGGGGGSGFSGNVWVEIAKAVGRGFTSASDSLARISEQTKPPPQMPSEEARAAWSNAAKHFSRDWANVHSGTPGIHSMIGEMGQDYYGARDRIESGNLTPALQKALAEARRGADKAGGYYRTALTEIGPAGEQAQLMQMLAPGYAQISRDFAARGISGPQQLAAKQQLAGNVIQQGYAAQQKGYMDYGQVMGDMASAMGMLGYQTHAMSDVQARGEMDSLRAMLMGGMEQGAKSKKDWGAEATAMDWVSLGTGVLGAMAPK